MPEQHEGGGDSRRQVAKRSGRANSEPEVLRPQAPLETSGKTNRVLYLIETRTGIRARGQGPKHLPPYSLLDYKDSTMYLKSIELERLCQFSKGLNLSLRQRNRAGMLC